MRARLLFTQQGDNANALKDRERLRRLNPTRAADLDRVVEGADEGKGRVGVAARQE